jgi:hypothetical protein
MVNRCYYHKQLSVQKLLPTHTHTHTHARTHAPTHTHAHTHPPPPTHTHTHHMHSARSYVTYCRRLSNYFSMWQIFEDRLYKERHFTTDVV